MAVSEEPAERHVEEVHCCESGVPLTSIPSWYASVRVKFVSNEVRHRNGRPSDIPSLDAAAIAPAVDLDVDPVEEVDDELIEDLDIEIDDPEVEADEE